METKVQAGRITEIPQVKPWIGKAEADAVLEVLNSGWITEGEKTKEFGDALLKLTGARYGVFAPNGTLAIYLALLALGIGAGEEVIVPDTTFVATATAVVLTGARPVFVDVEPDYFQMDVSQCQKWVNVKTRAIMPVHLYGSSADMDQVMDFANDNKIYVIEDAAQGIGVKWGGQHVGTFGSMGIFSFFADKTITTGEGGFVVTNNEWQYTRLRAMRNQGRDARGSFVHPSIGWNFRLTDMQSAMGLVQLGKLTDIKARKRQILAWYLRELHGIEAVSVLSWHPDSMCIPFRAVIFCDRAHELMDYLASHGVKPRQFFYPLHRQPCFAHYKLQDKDFPNAIRGWERGVCLPIYPELTEQEVRHICSLIRVFYESPSRVR